MTKVRIWGFRCERCDHEWRPRDINRQPIVCPLCKSPYWNRPRSIKPSKRKKLGV